jgi:hypothetical protein
VDRPVRHLAVAKVTTRRFVVRMPTDPAKATGVLRVTDHAKAETDPVVKSDRVKLTGPVKERIARRIDRRRRVTRKVTARASQPMP